MTDLIDAVTALTKPTRTKVVRDDGSTVVVRHDALLVQLETAVTSSITGRAGGGGQSTGNVLNSAALYEASQITSQINDWCRLARVRVMRGDTIGNLTRWMVAFAGSHDESRFYEDVLHGWVGTIRGLLDPRGRFQVEDPCVVCKADRYTDAEEVERRFPVIVEYEIADPQGTAVCKCLACDAQWAGWDALKELGEELSTVLDE